MKQLLIVLAILGAVLAQPTHKNHHKTHQNHQNEEFPTEFELANKVENEPEYIANQNSIIGPVNPPSDESSSHGFEPQSARSTQETTSEEIWMVIGIIVAVIVAIILLSIIIAVCGEAIQCGIICYFCFAACDDC